MGLRMYLQKADTSSQGDLQMDLQMDLQNAGASTATLVEDGLSASESPKVGWGIEGLMGDPRGLITNHHLYRHP